MSAYIYQLESEYAPWSWALAFDYNPEMVAAIKSNIPSRQRTWKSDIRQWWFKQDAQTAMLKLAERHCGSVQHVQDNGDVAPAVPAELGAAYRVLHLQPTAPDDLVKAAYRTMCKLHHPDKGGMTTQMQRINEAYGRLIHR